MRLLLLIDTVLMNTNTIRYDTMLTACRPTLVLFQQRLIHSTYCPYYLPLVHLVGSMMLFSWMEDIPYIAEWLVFTATDFTHIQKSGTVYVL